MICIQSITIDSNEPKNLALFWAAVLGWEITFENEIEVVLELLDGTPARGLLPDLLFLKNNDGRKVKNRLHLDLRPDNQKLEVQRLIELGAKEIEIGQSEYEGTTWVVMADPEGNEFCVLRALTSSEIETNVSSL